MRLRKLLIIKAIAFIARIEATKPVYPDNCQFLKALDFLEIELSHSIVTMICTQLSYFSRLLFHPLLAVS